MEDLPISPASRALNRLPRLFGGADVFVQAADLSQSAAFQAALQELEQLYHRIMQADPAVQVLVDFGLVNQAEYYTGVVFRGYLPGVGQPVLSGGRYDRLLNDFGLQKPGHRFCHSAGCCSGLFTANPAAAANPSSRTGLLDAGAERRGFAFLKQLRKQGLFCESSPGGIQRRGRGLRQSQGNPGGFMWWKNK